LLDEFRQVTADPPAAPIATEYRIVRPDGAVRWVREHIRASRPEGGRLRLDGVITDITERKRLEEDVRRWKDRYEAAVRASGPAHVIGFVIDVTEQKRVEERLRHAAKLEAVGRLAGGVAHRLNNALTVIGGYTDVLLGQVCPGDPALPSLQHVRRASAEAAEL